MSNQETGLQKLAHSATIIAALVTALTLAWGVKTFRDNSIAQRKTAEELYDAGAIIIMQEYNKVAIEHALRTNQQKEAKVWLASYAFLTAETIFRLRQDDPGWRKTVSGLIQDNKWYVEEGLFDCGKFNNDFSVFVGGELGISDVCSKK
jgi:hypothetical protein